MCGANALYRPNKCVYSHEKILCSNGVFPSGKFEWRVNENERETHNSVSVVVDSRVSATDLRAYLKLAHISPQRSVRDWTYSDTLCSITYSLYTSNPFKAPQLFVLVARCTHGTVSRAIKCVTDEYSPNFLLVSLMARQVTR